MASSPIMKEGKIYSKVVLVIERAKYFVAKLRDASFNQASTLQTKF